MGNSVSYDSRRGYARPGDIDPSIVETPSVQKHPEVQPNPNFKPPTPSSGTVESKAIPLRQNIGLNPSPSSHAPTTGTVESKAIPLRQNIGLNPSPSSHAPTTRTVESKAIPLRQNIGLNQSPSSHAPTTGTVESKPLLLRQSVELNRKGPAPLTGKGPISGKRVAARFELLPDQQSRLGRMGLSAVGQLVVLGLLLLSPMVFPQTMQTALKFDVVEVFRPATEIPVPPATPPPPPPKVRPKVRPPEPKPVELPEPVVLNPRQPHVFLNPKPEAPKVRTLEAKPLELNPILKETRIVVEARQPAPPKEEVKVGTLNSGSPAPVTVAAPLNKVQTGGFGDPNGLPGAGNPNHAANINRAGSPLLPGGPGQGNGTSGARGIPGVAAAEVSKQNGLATRGATTGVDILNKPNPVYSAEGRTLRVEGDVVLEVIFLASGQVQVTRVVSSLGHGLDEAAVLAAKQIRFRPAKRDGQPVDFPARVRIGFRLAE
jgi:protein TonB